MDGINFNEVPWVNLTIRQMTDELTNQGYVYTVPRLKADVIIRFIQLLTRSRENNELRPFTQPVQRLIDAQMRDTTRQIAPAPVPVRRVTQPARTTGELEELLGRLALQPVALQTLLTMPPRPDSPPQTAAPPPLRTLVRTTRVLSPAELRGHITLPPPRPGVPATTLEPLPRPAVPLPTTVNNPYAMLQRSILRNIQAERDVDTADPAMLLELDAILPDWSQIALAATPARFNDLTEGQIFYYAAAHGLDLRTMTDPPRTKREIAALIRLLLFGTNIGPTPPEITPRVVADRVTTFQDLYRFAVAQQQPQYSIDVIGFSPDIVRIRETVFPYRITPNLFSYPPTVSYGDYIAIASMDIRILQRAANMVLPRERNLIPVLGQTDLIFLFTRRYLPPLDEGIRLRQARMVRFNAATPAVREAILELYSVGNTQDYLQTTQSDFEQIILAVDNTPITDLAQRIGMIVPISANSAREYFLANVSFYHFIFTRPQTTPPLSTATVTQQQPLKRYLHLFTDEEIIRQLGVYIDYTSRDNLLDNFVEFIQTGSKFFIPLTRNCRNQQTVLLTDTRDLNNFMIAFGGNNNYVCYDPEELEASFDYQRDIETDVQGDFAFMKPDDRRATFKDRQIEQLKRLISSYPTLLAGLHQRIDVGLAARRLQGNVDQRDRTTFRTFDARYHPLIHQFFTQIFMAGMYMRRWTGPGCPYPLRKTTTEKKTDPDPNTMAALVLARQTLDQLPVNIRQFLGNLRMMEYRTNNYMKEGEGSTIVHYLDVVGRGIYCIRMASSKFITTGYAYLNIFFGQTIPEFNITEMDTIM